MAVGDGLGRTGPGNHSGPGGEQVALGARLRSSAGRQERSARGGDRAGTGRGQRGAGSAEEGRPGSGSPARVHSAQGAGFPAGPSRRGAPPAKCAPLSPRPASGRCQETVLCGAASSLATPTLKPSDDAPR